MGNKAERIAHAIKKACCWFCLVEWCENWEFTVDDFEAFIRAGIKHFDEEAESDGK